MLAVLVIVVALWNQVDYACKLLAPWQEMRQGPSVASKTLLLDYISPWIPSVLLTAFKNGHWAVFASSTGFALLKLTACLPKKVNLGRSSLTLLIGCLLYGSPGIGVHGDD